MRKFISLFLAFAIAFLSINDTIVNVFAKEVVLIHYHRDDNNYDGWNIWAWGEGLNGAANQFTGEDKFGKIAVIELDSNTPNIGFIVRTDDWEKDIGDDRFIDLSIGNEIWVTSGQAEFTYEVPEAYLEEVSLENVKVELDYFRYDNNYENLKLEVSATDTSGNNNLIGTSDFKATSTTENKGSIATVNIDKAENIKNLNVKVLENDTVLLDKKAYLQNIDESGALYLKAEEGKDSLGYGKSEVEASIVSAKVESPNEIKVLLSYPAKQTGDKENFELKDDQGDSLAIKAVTPVEGTDLGYTEIKEGYYIGYTLQTEEYVDFANEYTVEKVGYKGQTTTLGNVYDSELFNELFFYEGKDLGVTYGKENTFFRLWAPTAKEVNLLIYETGDTSVAETPVIHAMQKDVKGTWTTTLDGDYKDKFYTYEVHVNGLVNEAVDPYAKATGVNGMRGMIIDFSETNPEGFDTLKKPELTSFLDAIIYEIHVRDLSMDENSGIENKGKFLGFTEQGTKNSKGDTTGLDYIKDLGVTHIHLLPSYDYKTVDESSNEAQFNWGYDPQNYNVPEGSYSTDAYDGNVRVKEFKEMVKTLNENDLRVIMDVVYNHTFTGDTSNLNLVVPDYYYRKDENNQFTNGSGCGNETASERAMYRKYMVDSVVYWATEYKVDGFRFDLMGVHDIETMNEIRVALNEIDPSIIVYGEGWNGGSSPLPESERASKKNVLYLDNNIAAFSDDIRDGIKGDVFTANSGGFINGATGKEGIVKFGIVAGMQHPQVNISEVPYSDNFWANEPTQVINYISAHDNLTLWDKLQEVDKMATEEELLAQNKLGAAIVMTSQGIPFFQAGEEFARTKNGNENSYKSPDSINKLNWDRRSEYNDLVEYYKGLIELRKTYPSFKLQSSQEIVDGINFLDTQEGVVAYDLVGSNGYDKFTVIFNATEEDQTLTLENNKFDVLVNATQAGSTPIEELNSNDVTVTAKSTLILAQKSGSSASTTEDGMSTFAKVLIGLFIVGISVAIAMNYRKKTATK